MNKLVLGVWLSCIGLCAAAEQNLIQNGDFAGGLKYWSATHELEAFGEFYSSVDVPAQTWSWNLSYALSLEEGVEYRLRFRAKADTPRGIVAGWGLDTAPWTADVETFYLTDQWQSYELQSFVSYSSAEMSRVLFDYGDVAGGVYLDDVELVRVDGGSDNLLENGDFTNGFDAWQPVGAAMISESFEADVVNVGQPWERSLSQPVRLEAGVDYRLTFKAKASEFREIHAGWGKYESDWAADMAVLLLSGEWRSYAIEGQVSFGDFENGRVIFDFGHQAGKVFIDDVVFEKILPDGSFKTEDGDYTIGAHINEWGEEVITEVFFDYGDAYLTPKNFGPHGGGWIIDNAQASTVDGELLKSKVEFKGLYIEDCITGEWVNVQNTEYAYNSDPMVVIESMGLFMLNHYFIKTLAVKQAPLVFLNERFLCERNGDPVQYDVVELPGVDEDGDGLNDLQIVMVEGSARFAYVVEHRD